VLVAGDNLINQKIAARLLEKAGHTVTVGVDGRAAWAAWRKQGFDLVLMDMQMPPLNGFACTTAIRALEEPSGRRTPIVALTAHALKGCDQRCLYAGMDGYISKPMRPDELLAAIHRVTVAAAEPPRGMNRTARGLYDATLSVHYGDAPRDAPGAPVPSAAGRNPNT